MSVLLRMSSTFSTNNVRDSQAVIYISCRQCQSQSGRHLHLVQTMSDTVRMSSTFHADIVKHSQAIVYTECRQCQIYSGRHLHLVLTTVWTVLVLLSRNRLLLKNKFNHVIVRNGYGVLPGFIEYVKCTDIKYLALGLPLWQDFYSAPWRWEAWCESG